jgi:hypothetical protein
MAPVAADLAYVAKDEMCHAFSESEAELRVQGGSQASKDNDRNVPLAPFDLRNVGSIDARLKRKCLLRQFQCLPRSSHVRGYSSNDCRFVRHKDKSGVL